MADVKEPSYPHWKASLKEGPSLQEALRDAWARCVAQTDRPDVEYHAPDCPKIVTQGAKACRCGAAPLEAIFG